MITLKKITYSNFLATGAAGNEIVLDAHASTLISARNGAGKSTVTDAIIFALFGRPYRDINKNQLINSVNGKGCIVELSMNISGVDYVIRRGMKPNIFEIFKGGVLIDQEAATRDYQKFLEQQILKTNYRAFTQSVILGSANFTPFMQMRPHERREVTEDFLDVKIFGVMHSILKEEISTTKSHLVKADGKISVMKTKVDGQKNLIKKLEEVNAQAVQVIKSKITSNDMLIGVLLQEIKELENESSRLLQFTRNEQSILDRITEVSSEITKKKHSLAHHDETVEFFTNESHCPQCKQDINADHKLPIVSELKSNVENLQAEVSRLDETLSELKTQYDEIASLKEQASKIQSQARDKKREAKKLDETNDELENEILSLSSSDILIEKQKLKDIANEALGYLDEKTKLSDQRLLQDQAYDILKDGGVKTTIIKEYLPIINRLINHYLSIMEFYADFTLDETFSEVIRSRCRDEFTYNSFSEGEKKRIDIAILFAWRHVAKLKNSVSCNVLFLDEILTGSLDATGLDSIFRIIEEESKHSNVFVIDHNEQFADKFDNIIRIEKRGDFSIIVN